MAGLASMLMSRTAVLCLGLLVVGPAIGSTSPSPALEDYVARPDASFDWVERSSGSYRGAEYVELILTSQTWMGRKWRHLLYIVVPENVDATSGQALLFIDGGRWRDEYDGPPENTRPRNAGVFLKLAKRLASPVVIIRQVPYQPLFDGKTEDALIAYTFERFLEEGDRDWPLLLPMVKTVVRAMDVGQLVLHSDWSLSIERFTVTGASKRGWTTWLSAAVDERVAAFAPIVFDVLKIDEQLDHQLAVWGSWSEEISDYTARGLPEKLATESGLQLRRIADPWYYRSDLEQPKLIVLGTNDPFWPVDALNNYWADLEGPTYVLYIPNNGHKIRDSRRVINGLNALHRHAALGRPMPDLRWDFEHATDSVSLSVTSDIPPRRVVVWRAASETRDFRKARWSSRGVGKSRDGTWRYSLDLPDEGYAALFGEVHYAGGGDRYSLSTTVHVAAVPTE